MEEDASLVEIGPRFVLNLIKIFQGSFGGPTLYENPGFQSPNMVKSSSCLFTFLSTLLNCLLCLHLIFLFTHTPSAPERAQTGGSGQSAREADGEGATENEEGWREGGRVRRYHSGRLPDAGWWEASSHPDGGTWAQSGEEEQTQGFQKTETSTQVTGWTQRLYHCHDSVSSPEDVAQQCSRVFSPIIWAFVGLKPSHMITYLSVLEKQISYVHVLHVCCPCLWILTIYILLPPSGGLQVNINVSILAHPFWLKKTNIFHKCKKEKSCLLLLRDCRRFLFHGNKTILTSCWCFLVFNSNCLCLCKEMSTDALYSRVAVI